MMILFDCRKKNFALIELDTLIVTAYPCPKGIILVHVFILMNMHTSKLGVFYTLPCFPCSNVELLHTIFYLSQSACLRILLTFNSFMYLCLPAIDMCYLLYLISISCCMMYDARVSPAIQHYFSEFPPLMCTVFLQCRLLL